MLRSETGHENRVIIVTTATLVPMVAYCIHFFFAPDTSGGLPGHQQGRMTQDQDQDSARLPTENLTHVNKVQRHSKTLTNFTGVTP